MGESTGLTVPVEELTVNDVLALAPKADVSESNIEEIRKVIGWYVAGKKFKVTESNYKKYLDECRLIFKYRDVLDPLQSMRMFDINNRLTNLIPKFITVVEKNVDDLSAANAVLAIEKIGKLLKKKDGDTAAPIQINVDLGGSLTANEQTREIAEIIVNIPAVSKAVMEGVIDVECEDA